MKQDQQNEDAYSRVHSMTLFHNENFQIGVHKRIPHLLHLYISYFSMY